MVDRLGLVSAVILVALLNGLLVCTSGLALLRVLRAAARDSYSSPRRRLLSLDDGVVRGYGGEGGFMALVGAIWPWTTQKALLTMVTLAAALRLAWSVAGLFCWNEESGVVSRAVDKKIRAVFFGLDYFQAAAAFTLFTILARFWAELAYAARQGSLRSRGAGGSVGGGGADDYRPTFTPAFLWSFTRAVQRVACTMAFIFAAMATVLKATSWGRKPTYMNDWTGFIEAGAFILAAIVMVFTAYCAVVELRMVPIELPTRHRRVHRIVLVTGTIAVCLVARSVILVWLSDKEVQITTGWEFISLMAYMGFVDALPLAIVLMYNRVAPLSMLAPPASGDHVRVHVDTLYASPEVVPLIGGTGNVPESRRFEEPGNPFVETRPEFRL